MVVNIDSVGLDIVDNGCDIVLKYDGLHCAVIRYIHCVKHKNLVDIRPI